jgi:uncharacterized repeat protein (TIGR01451 family)
MMEQEIQPARRTRTIGFLAGLVLATCMGGVAWADSVVTLVWDANAESDLAGYLVKYGPSPGFYTTTLPVGVATIYTVSGLSPGTTYYFVVHAYDLAGNISLPSNEIAAVPQTVVGPVLAVSVSDAPDPVAAGSKITYTLSYANQGDTEATGVILRNTIPTNTSYSSATGGGTLSSGTVTWNLGTLLPQTSGSVQLSVQVNTPLANGTVISNGGYSLDSNETAIVSGPPVTTTVTSAPALFLSVSDAPDPVTAGSNITYTLQYSNSGNANTSGAVLTDPVPANTSFVSATGGGTLSSGKVTWSLGSINVGGAGSVQLVVRTSGSLSVGSTVSNSGYQLTSNETAAVGGPTVTTSIAAAPAPTIGTVQEVDSQSMYLMQAARSNLRVTGTNFQSGAVITLGSDITAGPTSLSGTTQLLSLLVISPSATLGPRTVKVTNPDGNSVSKAAAVAIVKTADINRDCLIDGADLNLLAQSWNLRSTDAGFIAAADLDGNNVVDGNDMTIWTYYFGLRLAVCP